MSRFVVDCSVTMAWCFKDEEDEYSLSALEALGGATAVAPSIWPLEVANVLVIAERRDRVSEADSQRFLALLGGLPIAIDRAIAALRMPQLVALARHHRLSAYDAAYLDLAQREAVPLATRDLSLRRAMHSAGIELAVFA